VSLLTAALGRARRMVGGSTGFTTAATLASAPVNLATGIIAARALSPDGRGSYAAIFALVTVPGYLASLGSRATVGYFVGSGRATANQMLSVWLVLGLMSSAVTVGALQLLLPVALAAQSESTLEIARWYSVTVLAVILSEVGAGLLVACKRPRLFAVAVVAQPLVQLAGYLILLALDSFTVATALTSTTCGFLTPAALGAWVALQEGFLEIPRPRLMADTASYGFRSALGGLSSLANQRLDLLVMPSLIGPVAIGYYAVASNMAAILVTLGQALSTVFLPAAAAHGTRSDSVALTADTFRRTVLLAALVGAAAALAAPVVVPLVYGPEFTEVTPLFWILLPGVVLLTGGLILIAAIDARGRPGLSSVAQACGAVVTVAGLAALLKPLGATGAALVSTFSYITTCLAAAVLYSRIAEVPVWRLARLVAQPR